MRREHSGREQHRDKVGLLEEIMEQQFALVETALYLDTHPADKAVWRLHNEFAREQRRLVRDYQERYGPLMYHHPSEHFPWRWIEEPWPWQINY